MVNQKRLDELATVFKKQAAFADGYSALYERLFSTMGGWLAATDAASDPLVQWLLEACTPRAAFDTTLLLMAAVHRDILAGIDGSAELSYFYPTAGGHFDPQDDISTALRAAIMARRPQLADFIQSANVQTNETGRGLIWLLPLLASNWPAVHLVDLGASAGLNMVAEQRAFRLLDEADGAVRDYGLGSPVQFVTHCTGAVSLLPDERARIPQLISRKGCDLMPVRLSGKGDSAEHYLSSFIWGDQPVRLLRLREAFSAFYATQRQNPIDLFEVDLPDALPAFLTNHVTARPSDDTPTVLYNTFITAYLSHRGEKMSTVIHNWALQQANPILWLQWEPPRTDVKPPNTGWLAYTADYWHAGHHQHFMLGWVQPHGKQLQISPTWREFAQFISSA